MQEHTEILSEAKVNFMLRKNTTFYSTLLLSVNIKWSLKIDTACINRTDMLINPAFFMGLSKDERQFLLFHEISHIALNHSSRKNGREHSTWNAACDYAINLQALDIGFSLINGALIDECYRRMSADRIYEKLILEGKEIINPFQDLLPSSNTKEDEEKVKALLIKAYTVAKDAGELDSIPTVLLEKVEELIHPKTDYRTILSNYCFEKVNDEYSFAKRNRRFPEIIMPSLYSTGVKNLTVAVDSSSSVTDEEFEKALNDVDFIRDILNPESLRIISFTTHIVFNKTFYEGDDLSSVSFKGRGGTHIQCVFDLDIQTDLLVVFSDMLLHMPKEIPQYEVLWVCINNPRGNASFGTLVHTEV